MVIDQMNPVIRSADMIDGGTAHLLSYVTKVFRLYSGV